MSDETPEIKPEEELPSPLRCLYGTAVSGTMAIAAYFVTHKVIMNFAAHPPTGNNFALRIAVTVRTLIVGISTMATGLFSLIAISLFLLGIKSLLNSQNSASPQD